MPAAAALESPDDPGKEPFPSAWLKPEFVRWLATPEVEAARFPCCAYGEIYLKPERFAGELQGLSSLSRECACRFPHIFLVGKSLTAPAAEYAQSAY